VHCFAGWHRELPHWESDRGHLCLPSTVSQFAKALVFKALSEILGKPFPPLLVNKTA
jgi:hypothetical protein